MCGSDIQRIERITVYHAPVDIILGRGDVPLERKVQPLETLLRTEKLQHIYSKGTPFEHTALQDVDFFAGKGEYIGILGHTGSGKSTFIQHLNGLIKPTSGRVLFRERDIYESKETTRDIRFKVGLVFQYPEYQLFEETVYKDIAFGPKNMKLTDTEVDERVREAADFVGLSAEHLEKSPFELSGGEKRRAAIAGVIAMRPEVLMLDEPTAGLDPHGCEQLLENIENFHKAYNSTIIMVSHNMDDIARCADRLVVFDKGRIALNGTPSLVFAHSADLTRMGLAVPQVTMIAMRLRAMGLVIPDNIYTVERLERALLSLKGGGKDA